jgi:hypothetical protein
MGPYVEIPAAALEEHVQAVQREDRADGGSMLSGVLHAVRVAPELVQMPQPGGVLDLEAGQFSGCLPALRGGDELGVARPIRHWQFDPAGRAFTQFAHSSRAIRRPSPVPGLMAGVGCGFRGFQGGPER